MVKCHENAVSSTRAQHFPSPTNRRQDLRIIEVPDCSGDES
jgi:hypothetical protein